jgi:signal transduction histidine kinase
MWILPKPDLKWQLTLRIAAVSAFCLTATSAYLLVDTVAAARARIEAIALIAAKDLELQQSKLTWVSNLPSEFPDLQNIATSLTAPGVCIAYRANGGGIVQRFCGGIETADTAPPTAFAVLYQALLDPGRQAARSVIFHGKTVGEAVAWIDPATLTAQAWHEAGRPMLLTLLLLCGLVYAALALALRPTRLIRVGLERIAANDLSARLPPFELAELSAIRDVFNHLAESLSTALAQRTELTRRLIALQDDERQHLARELHDEFGQCLAAIRALAASAGHTAARLCPSIASECDGIGRIATRMMETLRGTLFRLRSPDVEELGLAASLEGLVAGWNSCSGIGARFEIRFGREADGERTGGNLDRLPAAIGASLYRIAQEALTNAARHAEATKVILSVAIRSVRSSPGTGSIREIELIVTDDGRVGDQTPIGKSGMGLLGMRERVATLGGCLSFEAGQSAGSVLCVLIPLIPTAGCSGLEVAR